MIPTTAYKPVIVSILFLAELLQVLWHSNLEDRIQKCHIVRCPDFGAELYSRFLLEKDCPEPLLSH